MAVPESSGLLVDATIYLGAAVLTVPIFKRLRLGSVLGYLAAGAVIGPSLLGVVRNPQSVLHFAEFGVVLLLFVIGLELKPQRLWAMRHEIFGLGLSQVLITGAALAGIGLAVGLPLGPALVAGFALALSSTAFALQILDERGALNSRFGNLSFSILLFQDLAIVPLLALIPILAPGEEAAAGFDWFGAGKAIGAIAGVLLVGHYLLNPFFRIIALTRASELFTASALLLVVGASLVMAWAGLSMALGAFLAGVLLAESEYRHQLEADIDPFRGLFLGLFFIAVGMSVDWRFVLENAGVIAAAVAGLIAVKVVLIYALTRLFGAANLDAQRSAVTLSQGGEFAFVLFTVAVANRVMEAELTQLLTAAVIISMALTPLLGAVHEALIKALAKPGTDDLEPVSAADGGEVLVVGYGRVGQIVAQILRASDYAVTAIDRDPERIRIARDFGVKVYFGDVTRLDVLEAAGATRARAIFICVNDRAACSAAARALRDRCPNALLLARAFDRVHVMELLELGVDYFVRETFESSVLLASEGIRRLGCEADTVEHIVQQFRHRDQERLMLQQKDGMLAGLDQLNTPYDLPADD
ncbi:MAG: monovalent cation:proton antiporter-2 (CPA2) family protein [Kiloniellales bacterium]|nr:monovalent cation:proton antiporter-2 (CPA2) family protein [Kiloniellales bacterium]